MTEKEIYSCKICKTKNLTKDEVRFEVAGYDTFSDRIKEDIRCIICQSFRWQIDNDRTQWN